MLQKEIDEIFENSPNGFGITDDIFIVGYDINGKGHDDTL